MRSEKSIGAGSDLADWSQPIIVDYLYELYSGHLGAGHHSLRVLALSHGRMWRFLILGDTERLSSGRREVIGIARLAGLKTAVVDEIDQFMLAELMDVTVARFLRTPELARSYSQIVLAAAARLAVIDVAVA